MKYITAEPNNLQELYLRATEDALRHACLFFNEDIIKEWPVSIMKSFQYIWTQYKEGDLPSLLTECTNLISLLNDLPDSFAYSIDLLLSIKCETELQIKQDY